MGASKNMGAYLSLKDLHGWTDLLGKGAIKVLGTIKVLGANSNQCGIYMPTSNFLKIKGCRTVIQTLVKPYIYYLSFSFTWSKFTSYPGYNPFEECKLK